RHVEDRQPGHPVDGRRLDGGLEDALGRVTHVDNLITVVNSSTINATCCCGRPVTPPPTGSADRAATTTGPAHAPTSAPTHRPGGRGRGAGRRALPRGPRPPCPPAGRGTTPRAGGSRSCWAGGAAPGPIRCRPPTRSR